MHATATALILLFLSVGTIGKPCCFKYKNWKNPCENISCPYKAECKPALNINTYQCQCITECYDVGDSENNGPVCGTDGRDYPNECEMSKISCLAVYRIDVKYKGWCNPCSKMDCPPTRKCKLDPERKPFCDCEECSVNSQGIDSGFVCGSDGKTYRSLCHMRRSSCKKDVNLVKMQSGSCPPSMQCQTSRTHPYAECHQTQWRCPENCPEIVDEVCGDDGQVYQSLCHLKRESCLRLKVVKPIFKGNCGKTHICKNDYEKCKFGSVCRVNVQKVRKNEYELRSECERPECLTSELSTSGEGQVCGSNSIFYKSECFLRQEAFDTKTELKIMDNKSRCDACQGVQCPFHGLCRMNKKSQAECVCANHCMYVDKPVCGSDGMNYPMECELQIQACLHQKDIYVKSQGKCPPEEPTTAPEKPNVNSDSDIYDDFWKKPPKLIQNV